MPESYNFGMTHSIDFKNDKGSELSAMKRQGRLEAKDVVSLMCKFKLLLASGRWPLATGKVYFTNPLPFSCGQQPVTSSLYFSNACIFSTDTGVVGLKLRSAIYFSRL